MKALVIDSGGRGGALLWKLAQSSRIKKLYVAPGNGGTHRFAENVPIEPTEVEKLLQFVKKEKIDLTVASQDDSLALGIADAFQSYGLRIFAPTRAAAEIEWSKVFGKEVMSRAGALTASCRIFDNYNDAVDYAWEHSGRKFVKADGLAKGKGAYDCLTFKSAQKAIYDIMVRRVHKNAGKKVLIEDFLEGQEVSIHAWCDGKNFILFPPSQDHKLSLDGDKGDNTGGMGTIAPVPCFSMDMMKEAGEKIVGPILRELDRMGRPFVGCLYPGLKMTPTGMKVLEFNARFGDPETQSYMRLLKTDLVDIMEACIDGNLGKCKVEWHNYSAACIVMASEGYPNDYKKSLGAPISGIEEAEKIPGVVVFHAGTTMADGTLKTSGGRVLGVTARSVTLRDALETAYCAVERINFNGKQYRRDIGAKSLAMARF